MDQWQVVLLGAAGAVALVSWWPELRSLFSGRKDATVGKDALFAGRAASVEEVSTYLSSSPPDFKWTAIHSGWTLTKALCERIKMLEARR